MNTIVNNETFGTSTSISMSKESIKMIPNNTIAKECLATTFSDTQMENITNLSIFEDVKIENTPQFYEYAEFQLINMFEMAFGTNVDCVLFESKRDEDDLINLISNFLNKLARHVNIDLEKDYLKALVRHFSLHLIVPENKDNLVMRDYFNPVIVNHFNFYMYLAEYVEVYKEIIEVDNEKGLYEYLLPFAISTNRLIHHSLNASVIDLIVQKLVNDVKDTFPFKNSYINAPKLYVQKFCKNDVKRNFKHNNMCINSEYIELMNNRGYFAHDWIQNKIIEDKVPVADIDKSLMRFYMYHYFESEYYKLPSDIRSGIPAHIRSAVHSTLSELIEVKGTRMRRIVTANPIGNTKARDIHTILTERMWKDNWLNEIKTDLVFKDVITIKMLELNYLRDVLWDSKMLKRTLNDNMNIHKNGAQNVASSRLKSFSNGSLQYK